MSNSAMDSLKETVRDLDAIGVNTAFSKRALKRLGLYQPNGNRDKGTWSSAFPARKFFVYPHRVLLREWDRCFRKDKNPFGTQTHRWALHVAQSPVYQYHSKAPLNQL
ncbi:hypothetical protein [uncultured Sphaerochaeta sp.]|uniref:hypothetical protein n=1 Tax=uncultured Sphaerochaeta sp. TaxID=886478 RepID=UPI002A0A3552|nr:hypothetical protein [uncultured Sphaerochaeta sp.]